MSTPGPPYLLEGLPQHFLAVDGAPVAENCSVPLRVPLPAGGQVFSPPALPPQGDRQAGIRHMWQPPPSAQAACGQAGDTGP